MWLSLGPKDSRSVAHVIRADMKQGAILGNDHSEAGHDDQYDAKSNEHGAD